MKKDTKLPESEAELKPLYQSVLHGQRALLPEPAGLTQSIEGAFAPDFWSFGMFPLL